MTNHPFDLVILGGGITGIWTALRARERGLRVAVVEVGPRALGDQQPARPALRFEARENLGATRARNHVLTGNSPYWGGALARNPPGELEGVLGGPEAKELAGRITERYDAVERQLGVAPAAPAPPPEIRGLARVEVVVLPGKRRGLWSAYAARNDPDLVTHTSSELRGVEVAAGRLTAVEVAAPDGPQTVTGAQFVLSMGVIDTNLFVQRFLVAHLPADSRERAGRFLHDHWSLPLAKLRWRSGTSLSQLFPPRFARGGIVGRRLGFGRGFFHVTANFDALPPYDRVKGFLGARQRGAGVGELARKGFACFGRPLLMARAGLHYLTHRQLLVDAGSEVTLTLDFESDAAAENAIRWEGDGAVLDWDVRPADIAHFREILEEHGPRLREWFTKEGVEADWLAPDAPGPREEYLRANAIDAYHMGGGLQPGVTEIGGRLRGLSNVYVCGTAMFARPGPGNPVLTLLALSEECMRALPAPPVSRG